jgi:hypothetical protein
VSALKHLELFQENEFHHPINSRHFNILEYSVASTMTMEGDERHFPTRMARRPRGIVLVGAVGVVAMAYSFAGTLPSLRRHGVMVPNRHLQAIDFDKGKWHPDKSNVDCQQYWKEHNVTRRRRSLL